MNRREFLQSSSIAVGGAVCGNSPFNATAASPESGTPASADDLGGYTKMAQFEYAGQTWNAYENVKVREGDMVFVCGQRIHRLSKTAEPIAPPGVTPYLGLALKEVCESQSDLLAERILSSAGDPDEERVKSAVPPIGYPPPKLASSPGTMWGVVATQAFTPSTFISTKEAADSQPIFPDGNTHSFTARQFCPEITRNVEEGRFFDGLVGGWLPAIRKVFPMEDGSYWEIIGFPDTERPERFIVHSWHRIAHIRNGEVTKVFYRWTYPLFKPVRKAPEPEMFYRALLASLQYWEENLKELRPLVLPRQDWADLTKHAFVKELMARPGGVYPRYGSLDRIYGGSEHDGFQDTFNQALNVNLEWGRFSTAKAFIENYFDEFVEDNGAIKYRGPEMGQYGLMLVMMARYYRYTGDAAVLLKYQGKLQAIAGLLTELHVESLKRPVGDPGYGLIHGWSEADTNGRDDPEQFWKPYFGNSALASRGFLDLGGVWTDIARSQGRAALAQMGQELTARGRQLQTALIASVRNSVRRDVDPPFVGALPGTKADTEEDPPNSGRSYLELLQADVLPAELVNVVIDSLRARGGTTLGVPSTGPPNGDERSLMGFVSHSYAQALLRQGRVEEFLLYLYSHRYHLHQRGHWTAREAAGISRTAETYIDPYCTPAQQVPPLLIRWMLVLEDSEDERLYLGRGIPRAWIASGKEISIQQAPTRWGAVSLSLRAEVPRRTVRAVVEFANTQSMLELHLTLRVPERTRLQTVSINGRSTSPEGPRKETLVVKSAGRKRLEVTARYA